MSKTQDKSSPRIANEWTWRDIIMTLVMLPFFGYSAWWILTHEDPPDPAAIAAEQRYQGCVDDCYPAASVLIRGVCHCKNEAAWVEAPRHVTKSEGQVCCDDCRPAASILIDGICYCKNDLGWAEPDKAADP